MSTEIQASQDAMDPGTWSIDIPDDIQVMAADVASDYTPPAGWVKALPDAPVWVAPLGTQPLSETFALNHGRMSMAQARQMARLAIELAAPREPRPVTEAERLAAVVDADLVRAVVTRAVSPVGRPDVITPVIGQGLRAVAQLVRSLHRATPDQFHAELGTDADHCLVCQAEDDERRRNRLYPGVLNQVEAIVTQESGRELPRIQLLEILVAVNYALDELVDTPAEASPYTVATTATETLGRKGLAYPLADVARVVRAVAQIRRRYLEDM